MIKVYNTLTRKKEIFKPFKDKKIGMYVCGPTVYGPSHIGHARTYILFDVIRRYLEYRGYKVKLIMNITDVHDDIIKEANKQKTTIKRLADRFTKLFLKDLDSLKIKKAFKYPRVTEHIGDIIKMIDILVKKGYGYITEDGVYFNVSKFKDYGKLSGIKLKKEITGTRVQTDKYEKEDVSDFALWKFKKDNEPSWKSPWGEGRPGWHIECSVMSQKYLGKQFDIHGGAKDLIFPHHENEIAQSEAATEKKPFVRYWLHLGLLTVNGQKMSKSLKNYIEIPQLLKKYKPEEIRFFMTSAHYSSPLDYNDKAIEKTKNSLERLNNFIEEAKNGKKDDLKLIKKTKKEFISAMDDNFDTVKAWAVIFSFIKKCYKKNIGGKKSYQLLKEIDKIFKVLDLGPETIPQKILSLVNQREKYRKEKDWVKADNLREKIKKLGYWVEDTDKGPKIKKI